MAAIGTPENALRVAVIGSGPAGFYAAGDLLSKEDLNVELDMFDRLPTPFGLVRAGVAPDHPKIKNVIKIYEKTASNPGFRFFGNVDVGTDIQHSDLASRYHAVIYACGAQTDRHMGIPGEDLKGSHPATEFVAWYNAHPDFADREFDLDIERAVVIGNGNVAMDVARMLSVSRDQIGSTDVADHAIAPLTESSLKEVMVVGRRGPAQAAFTNPELLELPALTVADVIVDPADATLDPISQRQLDEGILDKTRRRNVEILQEYAAREPEGRPKRIALRFLLSPVEIQGDGKVEAIVLAKNELYRDGDGKVRPRETGETETVPCGMVLRSIGYKGVPIEGVPFDSWHGTMPNDRGRVLNPETETPVPGLYAVGWIKRGPSGVIGTNKRDAQETASLVLEDLHDGHLPDPEDPSRESLEALLAERVDDLVTYEGWQAIDAAESAAGEPQGRPRVKFASWDGLLEASRGAD